MAKVVLRGREVELREGDLVFSRANLLGSTFLAIVNGGMSHVVTVCKVEGTLRAVGVASIPWTDAQGRTWPAGITVEPLPLFNDPIYRHAWRVQPTVPRTQAQTALLRLGVEAVRQGDKHDGGKYETGLGEFVHSLFGWQPRTKSQWHCAELACHLAARCGAFSGPTESCSLPECAKGIGNGKYERLF